jgi:polyhydroxybutyrate depolymerase
MRFQILGVAAIACISFIAACGSDATPVNTPPPSGGAPGSGAGAPPTTAGSTSAGAPGAGGANSAGAAGATVTAGAAGAAGASTAGAGGAGAGAGGGSAAGSGGGTNDIHAVKRSAGCDKDITTAYPGIQNNAWQPTGDTGYQIMVTTPVGHPPLVDNTPIPAVMARGYYIKLPANYDKTKAYRLLYTGPGCGGQPPGGVVDWSDVMAGEGIQIGLRIYPKVWRAGAGGTTGPDCFDDKRGPLSVEGAFIEALHAKLKSELCIDENRVFMSGHSSGGWLTNQFGNSYGMKIFRAIAPSSGGLAQGNQQQTSDNMPVTGIWFHQTNDGTNPFSGTQDAITHALTVNGCTDKNFGTSPQVDMPFPNVSICKKFSTCPADYPIVLCREGGTDHSDAYSNKDQRSAAWTFFKSF